MKRWCFIFLLFAGVLSSAQTREELMARINQIKLDTEHYLYGSGTGEDQVWSEKDALLGLSGQVADYCRERQFSYIDLLEDIPQDSVRYITFSKASNIYRGIAYLSKQILEDAETLQRQLLGSRERELKLKAFVEAMGSLSNTQELRLLLEEQGPSLLAIYGDTFDDESQKYVDGSFLFYFDKQSGAIIEIMTPVYDGKGRRNLLTGDPSDPLLYRVSPMWVYFEGFNLDL